jgi:hypothetical protein
MNLMTRPFIITYSNKLLPEDCLFALERIREAITLINESQSQLSESEIELLKQINSFFVCSATDYEGATGQHGLTLSIDYIRACSATWLASLFFHESQHHLNTGLWKGEEAWRDEQSAGRVQLEVGVKLGFTPGERSYLEGWTADSNQARMQQHMRQGLRG